MRQPGSIIGLTAVEQPRCDVSRLCFGLEFVNQTGMWSGCCLLGLPSCSRITELEMWEFPPLLLWIPAVGLEWSQLQSAGRWAHPHHPEELWRHASHRNLTTQRTVRSISLELSCSTDYTIYRLQVQRSRAPSRTLQLLMWRDPVLPHLLIHYSRCWFKNRVG